MIGFGLAGGITWLEITSWRASHDLDAARKATDEALTALKLTAQGFVEPSGPPLLTDLPSGAHAGAVIAGRVGPGPHATGLSAPPPVSSSTNRTNPTETARAGGSVASCFPIVSDDLYGGCRAEVAWSGRQPFARLFWDAAIQVDGREIKRGPLQVDEVKFNWLGPPAPEARTTYGLDLMLSAGLSGPGALVLGEISPKRWAVSSRWLEGRFRVLGGVESLPGETRYMAGLGFSGGVGRR